VADRDRLLAADQFSGDAEQISALSVALSRSLARVAKLESDISIADTDRHNLQAALDESTAIGQQLRGELTRLGKDVNKILSDRGTLAAALDNAKSRLAELRQLEEAAAAEKSLFDSYTARLSDLVAAGQVRVTSDATKTGRSVLELDGDLLFDEGRSDIRAAGKGAVMEVARVLEDTKGKRFYVTVYSDEVVAKAKKATSWELSAARSVTLVRYLVSLGVHPEQLTAGGALSTTATATRGEKSALESWHRRVEVAILPAPAPLTK